MDIEKQYIENVDKLIPRPDIALDVLALAQDASSAIEGIARKIEQDPNLTANMLRMANSAYFGFMREITSVKDMVVRLGYDMVKILAITSASSGLLSSPQEAYNLDPKSLWYHSHACALLASVIAKYANIENVSPVYTAALLHDIGKVLLNKPLQQELLNRRLDKKFATLVELERCMLQTDHARVGMALLKKWGLPDDIVIPVGYHHTTGRGEGAQFLNSQVVYLANYLVESIGIRAIRQEDYMFKVDDFPDIYQELPNVPNFHDNMESIMGEFFNQFKEVAGTVD
ncbi:MAG: HDOD domain-containing protein [Desulfobulbaceae bacterium]|uniref:HDOD domain-containing protein n=1 Tax=Candidatus Desulfobia pelagia TaxID=2841692 RepID=A0A8J6TGM2_9BACT|nr:HDOD domain-containing protein [Candidatus Desulfobia pelagia]